MGIEADFNGCNRVSKSRQKRLGILANLFVEADLSLVAADCQAALERGANRAELVVRLVWPLNCHSALRIQPRVDGEHVLATYAVEELGGCVLRVFVLVDELLDAGVAFFRGVILFNDFALLEVKVDDAVPVVLVNKEQ